MELKDLTSDDRVALLELGMDSAATLTASDVDRVREIIAEVGEGSYCEAVEEAERRFADEDAVKTFLTTITRQDARERIYAAVIEAALPDSINHRESALLDWLATAWRVSVRIDPETDAR